MRYMDYEEWISERNDDNESKLLDYFNKIDKVAENLTKKATENAKNGQSTVKTRNSAGLEAYKRYFEIKYGHLDKKKAPVSDYDPNQAFKDRKGKKPSKNYELPPWLL